MKRIPRKLKKKIKEFYCNLKHGIALSDAVLIYKNYMKHRYSYQ